MESSGTGDAVAPTAETRSCPIASYCRYRGSIAEHIRADAAEAAREAADVADTEATNFVSDDSDSDDNWWEAGLFHVPPVAACVPLLPPRWGQRGFIPGHGFAQFPIHPAL